MREPSITILLIEDDPGIASALLKELAKEGYRLTHCSRGDDGLRLALDQPFHLVITDLRLPGLSGLELVEQLHQAKPQVPIILVTAFGTMETAIKATQHGAFDYLVKPFDMGTLFNLVARAADVARLIAQPIDLGDAETGGSAIIGNSRAMQEIYLEIGRVAATAVPVLIRGETGTGKELVARAIVQHGDRARKPFIAINCAAIPETLLESELFGHERGAFTGADNLRIGRFEQARGGTLFLDEIGDMSAGTQAKLLRVLEEKQFRRLGGQELLPADARIIAATHRDLENAMRERQFRDDLFYRLSVVTIRLPSLDQRPEDIPARVRYFARRHAAEAGAGAPVFQPDAIAALQARHWPGNVRELENVVRRYGGIEAKGILVAAFPPSTPPRRRLDNARNLSWYAGKSLSEGFVEDVLAR